MDAKAELEKCDVLIMTGGEDIDPSYYGQEPDPNLEDVNKERDVSDMAMLQEASDELDKKPGNTNQFIHNM